MAMANFPVGTYKNITATANIMPTDGCLLGVFCSTTSSGTIQFYDSATTSTATPITGAITLTAGTWYYIPTTVLSGVYAVIGSTANVTVITSGG